MFLPTTAATTSNNNIFVLLQYSAKLAFAKGFQKTMHAHSVGIFPCEGHERTCKFNHTFHSKTILAAALRFVMDSQAKLFDH